MIYYVIRSDGIVCPGCGILMDRQSAEFAREQFHQNAPNVEVVTLTEVLCTNQTRHLTSKQVETEYSPTLK